VITIGEDIEIFIATNLETINNVILWKWRHIVIVTSNCHNLNTPTVMVCFIQATSIVHST